MVALAPRDYDRLAVIDVGRSLQKVVLAATRMGLATCWIGPGADQKSVERHLGARFDPARDHVVCVCALGYESRYKPLMIRLLQRAMHPRSARVDELVMTVPYSVSRCRRTSPSGRKTPARPLRAHRQRAGA